ncbi:dnaJ homolog subfamily C member 2-like [Lineus longissimus]|uniref:dnaJ homolog subfamily C member 2-like n=1 Tax=Lineus longissimus TaxID=88925 RepID=UPI002B4D1D13
MVEVSKTEVVGTLSGLSTIQVEPVGRWFEAYCLRRLRKQTLSANSVHSSSSEDTESDVSEDEEDVAFLQSLDPTDWKHQDHYQVLGLKNLRYKATDDQIKRAYKKKVLKHHPDKRRAHGLQVKDGDDDYFSCITKAIDILGNKVKRRSYDSVDPEFDNAVPSGSGVAKDNFLTTFKPAFERNARWSTKRNVPGLGNMNSTFDEVNHFYSYWYDFDSWREYSYLDEEEKEKGENREERKWIERQNKTARGKLKKEEVQRLRTLVDNAYNCDPRIQKFKDDEKEKKLAHKRARQEAARAKVEEEERKKREVEEEERKKKEKEEEELKAQREKEKKEKDAQKKAIKKERKTFRSKMKEFDYFCADDTERVANMQDVEKLAELLSVVSLREMNEGLTSGDEDKAKEAFSSKLKELNDQIEKEKQQQLEMSKKSASGGGSGGGGKQWSEDEMQTLIKAVNVFPAGTNQRWEVVANFINQHCGSNFGPKDTLSKAKALQKMDPTMKQAANQKAFEHFNKESKRPDKAEGLPKEEADISARYDSVAVQQIAETGGNPAPWTADEQKLLEQALKTYPASTKDRWDVISVAIPGRSKKDCMKRYKELVELVRAKKLAQAAAAAKTKK